MVILQIEHRIPSFEGWKKAFDSDPIGRKKSGVKKYSIYRPSDDTNYVVIDLEFERMEEAKATLAALQNLWTKVEGSVMMNPSTRILELTEVKEY